MFFMTVNFPASVFGVNDTTTPRGRGGPGHIPPGRQFVARATDPGSTPAYSHFQAPRYFMWATQEGREGDGR
jgi:hypothetical protein